MEADAFEVWFSEPARWDFQIVEEEIRRVRDAYVAFQVSNGRVPDHDLLRICIMQGFDGDLGSMLRFWDGQLIADLPSMPFLKGPLLTQVTDLWRLRKIDRIVADLGLEPLLAWERRSASASLKSPGLLREVADKLEVFESKGFALVDCEIDEEKVATWYLRRPRTEETA